MNQFILYRLFVFSLFMLLGLSHAQVLKYKPTTMQPSFNMIRPPKSEPIFKGGLFVLSETSVEHPNNHLTVETIQNDHLYKRDLSVRAYKLDAILYNQWPSIDDWAKEDFEITFKGKESSLTLPLSRVWDKGGLVAVGDSQYKDGTTWPRIVSKKDNKLTVLSDQDIGFYLVWPEKDMKLPSFWGIEMILVMPKR